uniref:Uncharacterized protein n=1 Tax=Panagrolaimus davidi TaxID=227884 RepID=A0A914PBP0_9BILA
MGPSVIQLDVDAPKGCGNYEATKGILGVLGAYAASLDPSYDYYNSTDATFKGYETASILHASQYSEFALDPSQPIYLPKKNQLASGLALTDEERKPTEKDIKQFKAIYPK